MNSTPSPFEQKKRENIHGCIAFLLTAFFIGTSIHWASSFLAPLDAALALHAQAMAAVGAASKTEHGLASSKPMTSSLNDYAAARAIRTEINELCSDALRGAFCELDPRWQSWVDDRAGSTLVDAAALGVRREALDALRKSSP